MRSAVLAGLIVLTFPALAAPNFQSKLMSEKQNKKFTSRWTLADYLAQKNKVRLMDHWLAMNRAANWFEMILSGGPIRYELKTKTGSATAVTKDYKGSQYQMALYFWMLGLQIEHEVIEPEQRSYGAALALRLIGTSQQSTHLLVKYGLRRLIDETTVPESEWNNQFAEGNLQLYIFHFFGLSGDYRYYLPDRADSGVELRGTLAKAGAFVEFGIFRLFGRLFQERMESRASDGTLTTIDREGVEAGLNIYF